MFRWTVYVKSVTKRLTLCTNMKRDLEALISYAHIHTHAYTYTGILHAHKHTCTRINKRDPRTHIHTHTHISTRTYTHALGRIYKHHRFNTMMPCMYFCMYENEYKHMYTHTHANICIFMICICTLYTHKHRHGHTYTQTNIYSLCVYLHACMSLFIEVVHMPWRGRVCIGLQILVVVLNPRISCILCNRACPVRSRILLDSVICSTYTHTHTNTRTRTHTHTHTHIHPHTHINFETPLNSQEVTQCRLALMVL